MIGVINTLLLDYVKEKYGASMLEELVQHPVVPGDHQFRIDTYYSDVEWEDLYKKAVNMAGIDREEFEWDFGLFCGHALVNQFPGFVKGCKSARDMITRQPKIHNAISQSLTDHDAQKVVNNKFFLEEQGDKIIMHYASPNHMCTLYRSLATWVGDHFGEQVSINEPRCMKTGHHECEIHVQYTKSAN